MFSLSNTPIHIHWINGDEFIALFILYLYPSRWLKTEKMRIYFLIQTSLRLFFDIVISQRTRPKDFKLQE